MEVTNYPVLQWFGKLLKQIEALKKTNHAAEPEILSLFISNVPSYQNLASTGVLCWSRLMYSLKLIATGGDKGIW